MSEASLIVVEDDPLQRRLIKEHLEGEGFMVLDAATGAAALSTLRTYPVDVAIVDHKLGEENGLEVIRDMLKQNPLITPIMVTAYGNVENAVAALKAGAYDYIVKPIDFDKFLPVIKRALERQTLRREISVLRDSLEERFTRRFRGLLQQLHYGRRCHC